MASLLGRPTKTLICSHKFTSFSLQNRRDFKSALKIKWVRPEPVPFNDPKMTGDLATLGTMEMTQIPSLWRDSTELQSADENIKRIHTLEFLRRPFLKEEFMHQYVNRVKSHQLDDNSPEVKIAKITVKIRNLQIHMAQFPRDIESKVCLKESIDRRHKLLEQLKHQDYKKYEWILDKLDLEHKVYKFGTHERVERKKSLRRLTALYIEKVKVVRLQEYKELLESQQEGFLKEKLEKLIWMKKTEAECGAEQTVTDEDIESVRKQLRELQVVKPEEIME